MRSSDDMVDYASIPATDQKRQSSFEFAETLFPIRTHKNIFRKFATAKHIKVHVCLLTCSSKFGVTDPKSTKVGGCNMRHGIVIPCTTFYVDSQSRKVTGIRICQKLYVHSMSVTCLSHGIRLEQEIERYAIASDTICTVRTVHLIELLTKNEILKKVKIIQMVVPIFRKRFIFQ